MLIITNTGKWSLTSSINIPLEISLFSILVNILPISDELCVILVGLVILGRKDMLYIEFIKLSIGLCENCL